MAKTLKDFVEVYKPKSEDEQRFVNKHVTIKHKDRNGNGDDVFKASNVKTIKRSGKENHGYDAGEDEAVYEWSDEEIESLLDEAADIIEKSLAEGQDGNHNSVSVRKRDYNWGKMVTVHHGSHTSYPLHPEHQNIIKQMKDGDKASFVDETGEKVYAHRQGDTVHLRRRYQNDSTPVAHKHFVESVSDHFDDGWYTHHQMYGKVGKEDWKKGWRYNHTKDKPFYNSNTKTWHSSVKEDVQIDELSSETKLSYAVKATKNVNQLQGMKGQHRKTQLSWHTSDDDYNEAGKKIAALNKKIGNRKQGISRVTKEDIINKAIATYVAEDFVPRTLREKLEDNIVDLPESTKGLILTTFDSLNEDNQEVFVATSDSVEGINSLIDFAISMKGE